MAAFGWNSEEPVRAAAWRLACAARTQLKAYPGGGEDGGKEQRRRLGGLSRPACRGRGDAQLEERDDHKVRSKTNWGSACLCLTSQRKKKLERKHLSWWILDVSELQNEIQWQETVLEETKEEEKKSFCLLWVFNVLFKPEKDPYICCYRSLFGVFVLICIT